MSTFVLADDLDSATQTAVLFMLLIITWLAGASPAVQQGFPGTSLLPLLMDCILNRYNRLPKLTANPL